MLTIDIAQRILERVATGLNRQVSVTDPAGHILASTDTLLLGKPHPIAIHAIATGAIAELHAGECAGIGVPLSYADSVVGALVLAANAPQDRELARVAKTLAELIIHQMSVIEHFPQQQWVRDKFVYDLLHKVVHGSEEVMLHESNLLGIDLDVPRIVVVVDIKPLVEQSLRQLAPNDSLPKIAHALRLEQIQADLLDRLRAAVSTHESDVYSFIDDHRLILLAAVDPAQPEQRRLQIGRDIQRFLDDATRSGGVAGAAVGWYHPGWQALAQASAEAQFALEIGSAIHGPGRVFQLEDLGLASFVCSDNHLLKIELARRLLQPLDREPELLATLGIFLREHLSPSMTAQALHIHRHTLAYRLDKIAHLTGLNPRAFEAAAQLYAALILQKTNQPFLKPPSSKWPKT